MIEFAALVVFEQKKLSTRFCQIKDPLIEADCWAGQTSSVLVLTDHVEQTVTEKTQRLNIVEEWVQEMVENGSLLLDFTGSVVGQVNGLAVYDLGDFSSGRPLRITSQAFSGREEMINIEREASSSGSSHQKGVLILSGFLGARFGQERPLTLSTSLSFEQSYDGIDGYKASSTELYVIMAILSEQPLNQKVKTQPMEGVNQKVEGIFDVFRAAGLKRRPRADGATLGPAEPHVAPRRGIGDKTRPVPRLFGQDNRRGLEILTSVPAGEGGPDGSY